MQNLKIIKTTRKKKANTSNNWSGWRFMINNDRFERFTLFSGFELCRRLLIS